MSALTAILTGIGAGFLWCMAAIAAALLIGRFLRRRELKAPAPARTRVPGPAPVPGGACSPSAPPSGPGRPPVRPAPAPGHTHTPAMRLLTARFFTDGCVDVWDATGARTHRFEAGAPDLSDEAIERLIADARD